MDIIPDSAKKQVVLDVPQDRALYFHEGDKTSLTYRDETGKPVTIVSTVETKTFDVDSGMFRVTVTVEDESVYGGQTVDVKIFTISDYYDYRIPIAAVKTDIYGEYVFVLHTRAGIFGEEQFVQRLDITILEKNGLYASVNSFNLADRVVIAASQPVVSGQKVRVIENGGLYMEKRNLLYV